MAGAAKFSIRLRLDGEDVHPETVDTLAAIEVYRAHLRLLMKLAAADGTPVEVTGVKVTDECLLWDSDVSLDLTKHIGPAKALADAPETAPHGLRDLALAANRATRALGPEITTATLSTDAYTANLLSPAPPLDVSAPVRSEILDTRAYVLRAGGRRRRAMLEIRGEPRAVVVTGDAKLIKKLGMHLYDNVSVMLRVVRGEDGVVNEGTLLDVAEIAEGGIEQWREWFGKSGEERWAGVDDIYAELGR